MNMIKKGLLATAAAVTLGIAGMGGAYAGTYATSILQIQNLQLLRADNTAFTAADFSTLTGTNDAHATATFNATINGDATSVPIPGTINLNPQCAGPSCVPGALVPPHFLPTGVIAGDFGYADQNLTGSILAGGATAQTRADAATITNFSVASGNSDVGTSTTFQFALATDSSITFDFDAIAHTDAQVTAGSGATSNANARLSWSVNIVDVGTGTVVYSFAPGELNALSLRSATDQNPGTIPYDFAGHFGGPGDATASGLSAGTLYQLTIQHNTLANVLQEEVPEPATLAIVAAGLLSISLVGRRRKS